MSEHRDYETGCQLARDWLVAARDQLDISVVGDERHLEAAKNLLKVVYLSLLVMIVGDLLKLTACANYLSGPNLA